MRRAASRAACTAGNKRAISTPMIAVTTSNLISVKPRPARGEWARPAGADRSIVGVRSRKVPSHTSAALPVGRGGGVRFRESLLADVAHAPYGARSVVGDHHGPVAGHGHADGSAPDVPLLGHES